MKKIKNPAETYLVRIFILIIGLLGLIMMAINLWVPNEYKSYVYGLSLICTCLILWFGNEKVFHFLLTQVPVIKTKYKRTSGEWTIYISFEDEDGDGEKTRTGGVTMSPSLFGIRIKGKALLNPNTGKTTMNNWYAENAELIAYDDHEVLYYLYKIPLEKKNDSEDSENKFEKIGFVCASRIRNASSSFVGEFHDIHVKSGIGTVRHGKIHLVKND